MYFRCKKCGAEVHLGSARSTCTCGEDLPELMQGTGGGNPERLRGPATGSASSGQKRKRRQAQAARRGCIVQGRLEVQAGGITYLASDERGRERVKIQSDVPAEALAGGFLSWQLVVNADGSVEATPRECPELERIRAVFGARRVTRAGQRRKRPCPPNPRFPPDGFMGRLRCADGRALLRLDDGTEHPVCVGGRLSASLLEGHLLAWERVPDAPSGTEVFRPQACTFTTVLEKALTGTYGASAEFISHRGPQPPGSSPLEREPTAMGQLRLIGSITAQSDQRHWAELLSAWRLPLLHDALEAAMERIGWAKFEVLINNCPEGWPDGVVELVTTRIEEERERARNAPPPDYRPDDYGIADT